MDMTLFNAAWDRAFIRDHVVAETSLAEAEIREAMIDAALEEKARDLMATDDIWFREFIGEHAAEVAVAFRIAMKGGDPGSVLRALANDFQTQVVESDDEREKVRHG